MKRFVVSVGMVLAALTVAAAQMAIYPVRQAGPADVIGGTNGDLVGSTVGDSYGQTLVTGTGGTTGLKSRPKDGLL